MHKEKEPLWNKWQNLVNRRSELVEETEKVTDELAQIEQKILNEGVKHERRGQRQNR